MSQLLGLDGHFGSEGVLSQALVYCKGLGIEMRLSKHGAKENDLLLWSNEASAIKRLIDNNPRALDVPEILAIYRRAF